MPNRLANEPSLYLRQHANNPVNWYPWGEAAFNEAQSRDVPVLVSIGYSACHWCHVMERESFESDYIAQLMNTHFVCIKVDREEHPEVDALYMEAVQMLSGHGGWPLNVFCLPDKRPFFGGTYFPPEDTGRGIIPWPQLLMRISDHWKRDRSDLHENADALIGNMAHTNTPQGFDSAGLQNGQLLIAAKALLDMHDHEWGGFGQAPKFPQPMTLDFLLSVRATAACEKDRKFAGQLDFVINRTLTAMARGGLYDQFGGGFARYSVDAQWLIPHFEKMLYDNAQLIELYTKGWLRYREPLYAAVVEETIHWLTREMQAPNGLFYAALDADSDGEEGAYYVWSRDEVMAHLGKADGQRLCDAYYITEKGNFEAGRSNPALTLSEDAARKALQPLRERLLAIREQRTKPGRDEKQLVSWNALTLRALAEAGFSFGRQDWLDLATQGFQALWERAVTGNGRLHSVIYGDADARYSGTLSDYAYLAEAALRLAAVSDWQKPGSSADYLAKAEQLVQTLLAHFRDPDGLGCYFTADDAEALAVRKKDWLDNALPAGQSSLIHVLVALDAIKPEAGYASALSEIRQAYPGLAEKAPSAVAYALSGFTQSAMGVAVTRCNDASAIESLRGALAERPWRNRFILADATTPAGYQTCIGTQCLPVEHEVTQSADIISE